MTGPAYPVAHAVAPRIQEHFSRHAGPGVPPPDVTMIETIIDAAFWASLRREEGMVPRISIALVAPERAGEPLHFGHALPLSAHALAKLAPAVERPGIHLGVWDNQVWGATRTIPPFCFVVEVVAPGLLVMKHRPRQESRKFVNIAVLEADQVKMVDETASALADCPALLTSLLGFDAPSEDINVLVQLAASMRSHGRGGALLVTPTSSDQWLLSVITPILMVFWDCAKAERDNTAPAKIAANFEVGLISVLPGW